MHNYFVFDAHCDTLTCLKAGAGESLVTLPAHFNIQKQLLYVRHLQVADIWVDRARHDVDARVDAYIDEFYAQLRAAVLPDGSPAVTPVFTRTELQSYFGPEGEGRAALLLGIEGGECIDTDAAAFAACASGEAAAAGDTCASGAVDTTAGGRAAFPRLHALFDRGVRLITLTWNTPNKMSDTNCAAAPQPGLTEFGRAAVREMNRLGIMIDLSHISDAGFYDVMESTEKPVIASHSDSRALCGHPRNFDDAMFTALAQKGGVAGINFCTAFLGGSADLERIIEHIEHFAALGFVESIGIGSDFDGIERLPGGIDGAESLYKIFDRLLQLGYTDTQVKGIAGGNFLRVFSEVLPQ